MRRLACTLALAIAAAAASPAAARPPAPRPAPREEPTTEKDKLDAAIRAWAGGDWPRVRSLLEPLLQGNARLADPVLEESALRHLADATLQDESLDTTLRSDLATGYIQRLLDSSPDWRPPDDTHSKAFYALYHTLREQRDRSRASQCDALISECTADLGELESKHKQLQLSYAELKRAYENQEVEVHEKVARNRAVAVIPFGVGHFYNGRKGLGALFLTSELVFGGAGLTLLIVRAFQCERTAGFRPNSLLCEGDREAVVARRNAEQTFGLLFVGTLALDILLAQVTFRPYLTVKKTRVRRSELQAGDDDAAPGGKARRQGSGSGEPRKRARTRDILQAAPAPALLPGGAGLGVKLRF